MNKIEIVLEKLPLMDFLRNNMILPRFDIGNKNLIETCKNIIKDINKIKKYWEKNPKLKFGKVLIELGYVKNDPILEEINELKWMYNNADIDYKLYKQLIEN